ncbi:Ltp family lipoprotein [Methanobacterium congolense]|uniref:Zinc-ribbon domain-containing protein n=1 Tax=Methanobacterium congolense TaxID=118062 RepID=A0A1D3L1K0_9EURY|nr:Ltp family lipoprotein [Methanobacterium congolense]SCG85436.1 putative protein [Methanobacterium congolense]
MTKICPKCNKMNKDTAKFCEGCGTELPASEQVKQTSSSGGVMGFWNKQSSRGKLGIGIGGICCIGLILIVAISAFMAPDATTTTTSPNTTPTSSSTPSTDTSTNSSGTSVTAGQEQAAKMAQSYLDSQAFSRSGLIEQLKYEGFTQQEAEYGVDQTGADWNEQAAKMAQSYLDSQAFSRSGLIEQLEYEGFTRQQAEYGVRTAGL